jgi:outer membrane protein OmpA-like peptidoglycan-associated protein
VPPGRRRWLIGLGLAVLAVSAVDLVLWRQPAGDAGQPPPAAPALHRAATVAGAGAALVTPIEPPAPPAPPPAGPAVVHDAGFLDSTIALRDGDPCDIHCPRAYAALIAHARRLSLDFQFGTGSDAIDSRATRDLDRVVQFLRDYPGAKLLLLGFSDAADASSGHLRLSQHRAAAIAHELELRGIRAHRVEGFGSAMPIASSPGEPDRQRNRRVEIWLEPAH